MQPLHWLLPGPGRDAAAHGYGTLPGGQARRSAPRGARAAARRSRAHTSSSSRRGPGQDAAASALVDPWHSCRLQLASRLHPDAPCRTFSLAAGGRACATCAFRQLAKCRCSAEGIAPASRTALMAACERAAPRRHEAVSTSAYPIFEGLSLLLALSRLLPLSLPSSLSLSLSLLFPSSYCFSCFFFSSLLPTGGDLASAASLLAAAADLNAQDATGRSAILFAASVAKLEATCND